MVRLAYFSVFVFLALVGPLAAGNSNGNPGCSVTASDNAGCRSGWAKGNRFMLRAKSEGQDIRAEWRYEFAENRDLKLSVSIASGSNTETGAVFLIGDRAMLTNGLTLTPGQEIDTLGVPVLTLQLVLDLLERTLPAGPASIGKKRLVHDSDNAVNLKITTPRAKGIIPAPWRLNGAVERISPSRIAFDLTLAFKTMLDDTAEQSLQFSGYWEQRITPAGFPDTTKIDGWAIHRITEVTQTETSGDPGDFRAMPVGLSFPTLGALRKHISEAPETPETDEH